MAGCGYVCPQCEGKGYLDDGTPCDWCTPAGENTVESLSQNTDTE